MHRLLRRTLFIGGLTILAFGAFTIFIVPIALASDDFSDVPNSHFAHDHIGWLFDNGLTAGFPDGTYRPNNPVSRGEMAVFLQQVAGEGSAGPITDADKIDGLDSTAFLGATAKAVDSDKLDGLDSTAFLGATAKAVDADKLDGLDSTAFLGATAKAVDSDKLDGLDSTAFLGTNDRAVTASQGFDWFTAGSRPLATTGTTIVETSIIVPDGGHLLVLGAASTHAGTSNSLYTIWIEVDDGTCGLIFIDQPANSVPGATTYSRGAGALDVFSMAANGVAAVTAGTHTVTLCGANSAGALAVSGSIIAQFLADATVSTLASESTISAEEGPGS